MPDDLNFLPQLLGDCKGDGAHRLPDAGADVDGARGRSMRQVQYGVDDLFGVLEVAHRGGIVDFKYGAVAQRRNVLAQTGHEVGRSLMSVRKTEDPPDAVGGLELHHQGFDHAFGGQLGRTVEGRRVLGSILVDWRGRGGGPVHVARRTVKQPAG